MSFTRKCFFALKIKLSVCLWIPGHVCVTEDLNPLAIVTNVSKV